MQKISRATFSYRLPLPIIMIIIIITINFLEQEIEFHFINKYSSWTPAYTPRRQRDLRDFIVDKSHWLLRLTLQASGNLMI